MLPRRGGKAEREIWDGKEEAGGEAEIGARKATRGRAARHAIARSFSRSLFSSSLLKVKWVSSGGMGGDSCRHSGLQNVFGRGEGAPLLSAFSPTSSDCFLFLRHICFLIKRKTKAHEI